MVSQAAWVDRALCAGIDTEIFFENTLNQYAAEQAKRICRMCPVRQLCLDWAMSEFLDHGIFGGLAAWERIQLRRHGKVPKPREWRDTQPCGTIAAVRRHERRGEKLDDACREAKRERKRNEERRRRARRRAERMTVA